ncbi:septal ring lytic transglycosylase RlpA family protein [bacterium]|nr:MAG: septal ring lytic transglycosylase RlpA family protein [bacterium]
MTNRLRLFITAMITLAFWGCSVSPPAGSYRVLGKNYMPIASANGFTEEGYASWYGEKFHGKKTSSGETYDMYGRTCAHKTLPLGTTVKVTRTDNGKTVTAKVNDRGPFVEDRIVDLTFTLAKELGMISSGYAMVRLDAIDDEGTPLRGPELRFVAWQVASFREEKNARALAANLKEEFGRADVYPVIVRGDQYYRVYVGRYTDTDSADEAYAKLRDMEFKPIPAQLSQMQ